MVDHGDEYNRDECDCAPNVLGVSQKSGVLCSGDVFHRNFNEKIVPISHESV